MQKAIGVDALANKSLTQQLVVSLDMLILPQLLHGLTTTALLLARLEGKGVHYHVRSLRTNQFAQGLHTRALGLCLRTDKDGQTAVLSHDDLTHFHPLHGGIGLGCV